MAFQAKNSPELLEICEKVKNGQLILLDDPGMAGNTRSRVWSIFARIQNKNGDKIPNIVFCKSCKKAFNYIQKTTSNLVRHRCFKNFINSTQTVSIVEEEKPRITENVYAPVLNEHLTNLLTKWLIREYQPFDLLQSEDLKAIFNELLVLGSKFGDDINVANFLTNPSEARANLSEMYQQCFERVYAEIALLEDLGFGLTSCIWKNCFTEKNYIVLTAQYMKGGVLKTRFLGLRAFENEQNTNQAILNKIIQILEDFNCTLSTKCILVTDFAANFPDSSHDVHKLPCVSQLLNNAILKYVEQVPEVAEIVKACTNLMEFLIKIGETLLDGIVNNSYSHPRVKTYKMLCLIKEKWSDIEEILQSLNEKSIILTINIKRLEAVIDVLQPFEEAIETLEDDSSPTLHLVIVYLHELKKSCDDSHGEFKDLNFIDDFKEKLGFYLQKIMNEDIKTLHKIALFLHPPTNQLLQFNDEEKRFIEEECIRLMQNYKPDNKPFQKQNLEIVSTPSLAKKRKNLFSDFIVSKIDQNTSDDFFRREIELYKLFDVVYSDDFNVLNWWQLHKDSFPSLYKLSCVVLATPATCRASKRFLLAGNNLLTQKSISVAKEVELQKNLFLNANAEQNEL